MSSEQHGSTLHNTEGRGLVNFHFVGVPRLLPDAHYSPFPSRPITRTPRSKFQICELIQPLGVLLQQLTYRPRYFTTPQQTNNHLLTIQLSRLPEAESKGKQSQHGKLAEMR
jgi:hypothetical protein